MNKLQTVFCTELNHNFFDSIEVIIHEYDMVGILLYLSHLPALLSGVNFLVFRLLNQKIGYMKATIIN